MTLLKLRHTAQDPWRWRPAQPPDIPGIVDLVTAFSGADSQGITEVNPVEGSRNVMHAVVNQTYNPKSEMISVATLGDGEIIAFNWAQRDLRLTWSTEEYVFSRFMSIHSGLTGRIRMALAVQSILQYERWAQVNKIPLVISTSMRQDWQTLMRIHQRLGWTTRGSTAYKRMNLLDIDSTTNKIILP